MTNPVRSVQDRLGRVDQRWRDLPLRTRLTSAAALGATVTILAVVSVAYIAVRHELRGQIDTQLRRQVTEVRVDRTGGTFTAPRVEVITGAGDIGGYSQVLDVTGQGIAATEFGELIAAIRAGAAYANVHSTTFPPTFR